MIDQIVQSEDDNEEARRLWEAFSKASNDIIEFSTRQTSASGEPSVASALAVDGKAVLLIDVASIDEDTFRHAISVFHGLVQRIKDALQERDRDEADAVREWAEAVNAESEAEDRRAASYWEVYRSRAHALQTSVAYLIERRQDYATLKDLRVGLDVAFVDAAALARLLLDRGIFTEEEYAQACAEAMEREVKRREVEIGELTGTKVNLL